MAEKTPEKVPEEAQEELSDEWGAENAYKIKFSAPKKPKLDTEQIIQSVHNKTTIEWNRTITDFEDEFLPKNAPTQLKLDGYCPYVVSRDELMLTP